jgi:hypothetical protein
VEGQEEEEAMTARVAPTVAVAALLTLGIAAPSSAAVRWAEPGGDGPAGTCPESDPCEIETAVEHTSVVDGDEVIVKPGDYTLASPARLEIDDGIDLHGQLDAARPTINLNTAGPAGIEARDFDADARIRYLRVVNAGGGAVALDFRGVIERVIAVTTSAGGFACNPGADGTIRDSVCWANATSNAAGLGTNTGPLPGDHTVTLRNVTAVSSVPQLLESTGISFSFHGPGVNVDVDAKSVIAQGEDRDIRAAGNSGATTSVSLDHSNYSTEVEINSGTVTDPGTGTNQTAAPLFVDAAAGDFHQAPSSPTIDAGAVDGLSGALDLFGDARVLDGDGVCPIAVDIGADEFSSPDPAPDCTPPNTMITSGPTGVTADAAPTFAFSATEPGSSFRCRVDGGAFSACSSPRTVAALSDGMHVFRVRATDAGGNTDATPAVRSFEVDTTPPETTIDSAPKARTKRRRASFEFSSDEPGSSFECSLDGAQFAACDSPFARKVKRRRHSFEVRAADPTGNVDGTPAEYSWKVKKKRKR